MDGRLLWALLSVTTVASLASAAISAFAVLAWHKTAAGRTTNAIETGLRVVTFRLAKMDGHLGALDASLRAEAAKTIGLGELEQLLAHGAARVVPPPSGPRELTPQGELAPGQDTLPPPSPPPSASQPVPSCVRRDTVRLQPEHVVPLAPVLPPAWVTNPGRENQG